MTFHFLSIVNISGFFIVFVVQTAAMLSLKINNCLFAVIPTFPQFKINKKNLLKRTNRLTFDVRIHASSLLTNFAHFQTIALL